jgi:hypothetical protein
VVGPGFNDDFGDMFGLIYGFIHRELRDDVEDIRPQRREQRRPVNAEASEFLGRELDEDLLVLRAKKPEMKGCSGRPGSPRRRSPSRDGRLSTPYRSSR